MKNVHVIPTDKPSRLYLTTHEYIFEEGYSLSTDECENKNIYITNDEEIKEGDYGILGKTILSYHQMHKKWGMPQGKKIILTTDQDLIKDGVQNLSDEFLECFVNNPSCESVEVQKWFDGLDFLEYKIIILKEEPKQETLEEVANKANGYNVYAKETKAPIFNEGFIAGAKWQQEQDKKCFHPLPYRLSKSDVNYECTLCGKFI
jgi:hypothetical protein